MPSVEEINAWPPEQLRAEIRRMLVGGVLEEGGSEGWATCVLRTDKGDVLWNGAGPDRRILLLDAYGWLWLRNRKPSNPVWKPRPPGGARPAARQGPNIPDPPDIDPEEIRAVYQKKPTKR